MATENVYEAPQPRVTTAGSLSRDTENTGQPSQQVGTRAALRTSNFLWFFAGTTLINAAHWIQQVTLSWLVYDLTSSGALLGTLNLVRSIATVGLAPVAGVIIDRFPRRKLLYATSLWLAAICLGFGLVLLGYPTLVWPLFLFSFLGGIGLALCTPLRETIVFSIVPLPSAPRAVALIQTGWAVMRSIGPAIGGFLILWVGPAGNFFAQAGAYALVSLTILKLHLPQDRQARGSAKASSSFREGWDYIASNRTTQAFLLMSAVLPLFIIPNFGALPPIYAKDVFSGGPDTLGALLSAIGIGGIAGGLVTVSLERMDRRGLLQLGSLLFTSLSLIGVAFSTELWMALLGMVFAGFFEMIYLTTNQTLLQISIPEALRGRVTGIISLRAGLFPVGAFIGGVGSDMVGPRAMTLILAGISGAIAVIAFVASPTIRDYRLNRALEAAGQSTLGS
jgi:MFS family permease